jgi:hypothetical protein
MSLGRTAIILGASIWPKATNLSAPASFAKSANDFAQYLCSPDGLNLRSENLLNLFDTDEPSSRVLQQIAAFLKAANEGTNLQRELIFYYVGHGAFHGSDYLLALRSTNSEMTAASSLRVHDLADVTLKNTAGWRRFFILDCCFAAAAYSEFQSAPLQVAVQRVQGSLPPEGTSLLCASGARDPAKAPKDEPYTMFSGAFLEILKFGTTAGPPELSFLDVAELSTALIQTKYADDAVRPEVHTPEKRKGDIALIPLFPNAALRADIPSRLRAIETQLISLEQVIRDLQRHLTGVAASKPTIHPEDPNPVFTLLEVKKTLRFSGDGQSVGHLQRFQTLRANSIANEFWICSIAADGSIQGINLDGDGSPSMDSQINSGLIDVVAKYPAAIAKGQTVEMRLEYDLVDSFKAQDEYLGHMVQHVTERVILEIEFGVRRCLSGAVYRKYAGTTYRTEIPVERSQSGSRLRTEITLLKVGEEYRLAWRW